MSLASRSCLPKPISTDVREPCFREDLAYIHDSGFSHFVLNAAPGLLQILRFNGVDGGLVLDLGCGSGRWAREFP
jgi:hypothetical protein